MSFGQTFSKNYNKKNRIIQLAETFSDVPPKIRHRL